MLQLAPQSRVFLALEPADFRNYVLFIVMRSWRGRTCACSAFQTVTALHNGHSFV